MKFSIKHEINGRFRIHVFQKGIMSLRQADLLQYYLETLPGVQNAKVYERTADAVILYKGDRKEILEGIRTFSYENEELEFISQYCAAKDKDFESISLNDLAATLRENKQHLYSYTSKQEIRESTVTDPETGEETTVSETWMVYTVRYNGESYFSDVVFQLTDDQKELASDYASNLSLFLGDGLLQNLEAWTGNSITALGDVTFTDGITPVVYYNQLDERYAGKAYGTDNIGGYGCGPTAMAIVVSSLTDDMVDPVEMAEWSYNNGYWCKSSGSYHALIPAAAGEWGLPVSGCTTAEPQRITDALANGKLVVAIMSEGHFTSSGHFIVLRGVKDGKIMVADPASYTRSEQLWDLSIILNEASRRAGAGGPFWIIG